MCWLTCCYCLSTLIAVLSQMVTCGLWTQSPEVGSSPHVHSTTSCFKKVGACIGVSLSADPTLLSLLLASFLLDPATYLSLSILQCALVYLYGVFSVASPQQLSTSSVTVYLSKATGLQERDTVLWCHLATLPCSHHARWHPRLCVFDFLWIYRAVGIVTMVPISTDV